MPKQTLDLSLLDLLIIVDVLSGSLAIRGDSLFGFTRQAREALRNSLLQQCNEMRVTTTDEEPPDA